MPSEITSPCRLPSMKQGWQERQDEQMKEKYYGYCPVTVHRKSHLYTWGNVVRLLQAFTSKNNWMFLLSWKRVLAWFLHGNIQTRDRCKILLSWGHSLGKQTRFGNPRADKTQGCEMNNFTNIKQRISTLDKRSTYAATFMT